MSLLVCLILLTKGCSADTATLNAINREKNTQRTGQANIDQQTLKMSYKKLRNNILYWLRILSFDSFVEKRRQKTQTFTFVPCHNLDTTRQPLKYNTFLNGNTRRSATICTSTCKHSCGIVNVNLTVYVDSSETSKRKGNLKQKTSVVKRLT